MESSSSSPDEINRLYIHVLLLVNVGGISLTNSKKLTSNALSNNKRKLQDGPQEMPLPKHVCWAQGPVLDPPSDFQTQSREVETDGSHKEIESDPESAKDSNSFQCNMDSAMATDASGESSSTCTGCLGYEYGPALDYEGHLIEFGGEAENCADEEIENMLYLNGIAPSDYVLSSGRWSVVQDTVEESKKPTIDKEFEEYFSMLML